MTIYSYMQLKAFLRETAANCEFYMTPVISKLWIPHFLLSAGQWGAGGQDSYFQSLIPYLGFQISTGLHVSSGVIEVKRGKKEDIFHMVSKELMLKELIRGWRLLLVKIPGDSHQPHMKPRAKFKATSFLFLTLKEESDPPNALPSVFLTSLTYSVNKESNLVVVFFFFPAPNPEASTQLFWSLLRIYTTDLAGNKWRGNTSPLV